MIACAVLARALQARGHTIALMLRDQHPLSMLPETKAYDVFQAPRYAQEGRTNVVPASCSLEVPAPREKGESCPGANRG